MNHRLRGGSLPVKSTRFFVFILSLLLTRLPGVSADTQPSHEYQMKAAFLYNFAKFTSWPEGAFINGSAEFTLCVFGRDPFGSALTILSKKRVRGRKIKIKRFQSVDTLEPCHLLFINTPQETEILQVLSRLTQRPVLTVGDVEAVTRLGGVINFVISGKNVRFEINVAAARQAKLEISSRLLKLAHTILGQTD